MPILSFKNNIDSLIAALSGALFIFLLTSYHGVGISPDSVSYAGVARNIPLGKWLVEFNGCPLIIFPAGYPVFLGIITKFAGTDVVVFAPFVNALLFGVAIFVNGCLLQNIAPKNKWYKWAVLSLLPISYAMLDIYTMLWSETLFVMLVSFFMVAIRGYLVSRSLPALLLAALVTALACDTRLAGISVLATGLFFILLQRDFYWLKKIIHLTIYLVASASLLATNLIRNQLLNGTMTGIRQKSITPLIVNIRFYGETLLQWLQLTGTNKTIAVFAGILLVTSAALIIAYRYFNDKQFASFENINLGFCFIYICFIVLTASISKYEQLNNRLLSPAYLPMVVGISSLILLGLSKLQKGIWRNVAIACIALCYLLFQGHQLLFALEFHSTIKENGIPGYTEVGNQESDIVQFLEKKQPYFNQDTAIYSNVCDAVYFYGGLPAITLPEKAHIIDIQEYYLEDPNYIVWFTNEFDNKAIIRLAEISQHRQLDTLGVFKDGLILLSKPKVK
ncbi:hypothetical protein [Parasediminibacterium sp. JCM 36343]|uniref:hypothetical protein n=1 Tax=Parasediminibacterium sp. JCM 36343 TaxID=3374279 RepID=UPI00397CB1F2